MAHNENDEIQFAADVIAPPAIPAAGAATSLARLKPGGAQSARNQRITLIRASGVGDVTLTGPVVMVGIRAGRVAKLGELNDGADIVLAAGLGHAEIVQFVGTYDEFELIPAAVAGGGYDGFIEDVGEGP